MSSYRLLLILCIISAAAALTCYNGLKLVRGGSVGESTEDCESSSAYCYNMSASALLLVDVVKAGCSTWRCMLARDKCIGTTFQGIPVSLCCCSSNRCNVGGNSIGWDPNTNWNQNDGQGGFGNNNNNNNNNGFQQNYPDNTGDGNMRNMNQGSSWASPDNKNKDKPSVSRDDVEKAFRMDVDSTTPRPFTQSGRSGGDGVEEEFVKMDVRSTTPRPSRHRGASRSGNDDEISIP